MPMLGLAPCALALGPRGETRLGLHLVVVKVSIDREPVLLDPLGLTGCVAPGSPLDHTACITFGMHKLWDLLVLLQGLCSEK